MNVHSRTFRRGPTIRIWSWAASVTAIVMAGSALAGPLHLKPGASGAVPTYDLRSPGSTTLLAAACGYLGGTASCTTSTSSLATTGAAILTSPYGGFIEVAGTTGLNPYGSSDIALAFIFGGADALDVTSATLSSLSGYSTAVEACGPIFGSSFQGCSSGTTAGMAARSTGAGDSVTFSSLVSNPILLGPLSFPATDGYVLYTSAPASALIDPNNFTVDINGHVLGFAGFGLQAPTISVPEPGVLALFGAGLISLLVLGRRRWRAPRT